MQSLPVVPPSFSQPLPLVLLHGLLSTPREFGMVMLPMRCRGARVIGLQIDGYTAGDRRHRARWQDWADAAERAIERELAPGEPFVIGGLCSGGLLAAALAARGRLDVRGLVMMSPTFEFDGWAQTSWRHWRRLGYALRLDRWISVPERAPYGVKNPKIRAWVERDLQQRADSAAGPSSLPLWAIHEVERLGAHVVARLRGLPIGTLVMHAREDEICSLAAVRRALDAMALQAGSLVVLEDSFHMITIDNDRHRVVAELLRCIGVREPSAQAPLAGREAAHEPLHEAAREAAEPSLWPAAA
jgi:carboxylesterase